MRILALAAEPPWPPRSGYRIRCSEILRRLAAHHEVHLFALGEGQPEDRDWPARFAAVHRAPGGAPTPATLLRSLWAGTPHHVMARRSAALESALREAWSRADVVYAHYLYLAAWLPPPLGAGPARVLDQHNVDHEVWDGLSRAAGGWPARAWLRRQARLIRRYERQHVRDFDTILCVSERDASVTRSLLPAGSATRVVVAVNGADVARLAPGPAHPAPTVVFTGTSAHRNVEGLSWFVRECWPAIRGAVPGARFLVAGAVDPGRLPRNVRGAPGVALTGPMEDLGPTLSSAHVAVVPVRLGGGTKLKVFEAMAAGVAVVTVPEACPDCCRPGIELLAESGSVSYGAAVSRLLLDSARRGALAAAGRRHAIEHHSWDRIAAIVEVELQAAAARIRGVGPS